MNSAAAFGFYDTSTPSGDRLSGRRSVYASLKSEIDNVMNSYRGTARQRQTGLEPRNSHSNTTEFRQRSFIHSNSNTASFQVPVAGETDEHSYGKKQCTNHSRDHVAVRYKTEDPWSNRVYERGLLQPNKDYKQSKTYGQICIKAGHLERYSQPGSHFDDEDMPPSLRARPGSYPPRLCETTYSSLGQDSQARQSLPPRLVSGSVFSEDKEKISLYKAYRQRVSMVKDRAVKYLRDSFVLNKEERSYFQARRGMAYKSHWSGSVDPLSKRKRHSGVAGERKRQR
ncbi:hypothetical protein FLAG1_11890 [Fusarium langsethiae]|uniref:Uncharacterized protein n=1 Tax=Fusarium langsethiae TaxID=179993 RepID=A0A0M9ELB4_FUSLA|nr:hypothetical protein FLAG1_11890 [Fusarium langsethiae]